MNASGAGFSGSWVREVRLAEAVIWDREEDAAGVVPQVMEENMLKAR